MAKIDLQKVIDIVKQTDSMFFNENLRGDVTVKGDCDFVTKADLDISDFLKNKLKEQYPEIGFISEEEKMAVEEGKSYWILDPIDGTTNFMHAMTICGVSLALYQEGEIKLGVIYAPYTNELFWAQKGGGAYLNGNKIACSQNKTIGQSLAALEYNAYYKEEYKSAFLQAYRIYNNFQDIRTLGSATMELAYVACGRLDAFLGRFLKPWDYAAAWLLIVEAGGKLGDLSGEISLFKLNRCIVATNAYIYEDFVRLLNE